MPFESILTEYDPLKAGSIDGTDTIPHDRGIVCALKSTYLPPKHTGSTNRTLFVGRLNPETTTQGLTEHFANLTSGQVTDARVVVEPILLESRR